MPAGVRGEYNITETVGFNITFCVAKYFMLAKPTFHTRKRISLADRRISLQTRSVLPSSPLTQQLEIFYEYNVVPDSFNAIPRDTAHIFCVEKVEVFSRWGKNN